MKGHLPEGSNPFYCYTENIEKNMLKGVEIKDELIEKHILEQGRIKAEFDSLCGEYGLRKGGGGYVSLLTIFSNRRGGRFFTYYESLSDKSTLELARMLLSFRKGEDSIIVGGEKYDSPTLVEMLEKSLEDALRNNVKRVRKQMEGEESVGDYFIFFKPSGKGRKRGYYFPYPEGVTPQEKGFSQDELEAILSIEKKMKEDLERMQGNVRDYTTPSRNPELGELVLSLTNYLPEEWNDATRNAFLADFLQGAGFLNFKGSSWLMKFSEKGKAEKDREVRNWIQSYKKKSQG